MAGGKTAEAFFYAGGNDFVAYKLVDFVTRDLVARGKDDWRIKAAGDSCYETTFAKLFAINNALTQRVLEMV